MFEVDLKDQKKFLEIWKKSPRKFENAMVGFVNTYAFKARNTQIDEIHRSMTVRSPQFVKASIGLVKARRGTPVNSIVAWTGAKTKDRSDAFVSQELGTKSKRKKTINQSVRDNKKTKIKAKLRINRKRSRNTYRKFQKEGISKSGRRYNHSTKNQAMVSGIIATRKGLPGAKKPLEIRTKGTGMLANFKPGIYERDGDKLVRVQHFGKSPARTRKNKWHVRSITRAVNRIDKTRVWGKEIAREFRI